LYNMVEDDVDNFHESEPFEQQNIETLFLDVEENIQLTRFFFYYFILIYYPTTLNLCNYYPCYACEAILPLQMCILVVYKIVYCMK